MYIRTGSVYYKGILRHLSVIPLGGGNVTKDLTCLQIEEPDAEKMKLKYAKAYTDINNIDPTLNYPIDKDRVVESKKFIEIVEARVEEIVENAWFQIPVEFSDKLLGGIILTGGGSNMPEIDKVFKTHTHIDKVRIAKFVSQTVNSKDPKITNHDGTMNTVLGLLAKGDMNCAGDEIGTDLFSNSAHENNICETGGESTYVKYNQVCENEFFATTQKGMDALVGLKKEMIEKYNEK